MTVTNPIDARPLDTDEDVLTRVRDLVERGYRRQLWLLFLEPDGMQLPVLPRIDIPRRPDAHGPEVFANILAMTAEVGASAVVVVYERPGPARLTPDDRAWLRLIAGSRSDDDVTLRGPLIAHGHGVRWVGAEDLDDPAPVAA